LCLQPEQYFDDDKHFPEFLYIFEKMIEISNKHSTFIGSKEEWKWPRTLFGTTKVTPIHATQKHSQCNCMFVEYAKFVGETHKRLQYMPSHMCFIFRIASRAVVSKQSHFCRFQNSQSCSCGSYCIDREEAQG